MAGTIAGTKKTVEKILQREPDFYKRIGRIGGTNGKTGGFYNNPELARIAGAKGGSISRRKSKNTLA